MYHSITFVDVNNPNVSANTWDDWHLIPATRPVVKPPKLKEKYVDIPGANGSLDMTEFLTGYPLFDDRSGSIDFYVENDYWNWEVAYSVIMNFLHGRRMKMYLEDDPSYYYEGRFSINDWASEKTHSKIVVNYRVGPYKKALVSSVEDWLWDPFNFETGIIEDYVDVDVPSEIIITGGEEPITPTFIFDGTSCEVTYQYLEDGSDPIQFSLESGSNRVVAVVMKRGRNKFTFTGDGTVSISYRGGSF